MRPERTGVWLVLSQINRDWPSYKDNKESHTSSIVNRLSSRRELSSLITL